MMKKSFLISLFGLFWAAGWGQPTNLGFGDVTMPDPQAASLAKYGDIPVSYHTGVPQISVPIHTITDGTLSIDIALSYHASGIRVSETASNAGLGWSLHSGGIITRSVAGLPDEWKGIRDGYLAESEKPEPDRLDVNSQCDIDDVKRGMRDGEPDIFYFNAGGYSGKFVFTSPTEVMLFPKQDIDIELLMDSDPNENYHRIHGFVVMTPEGHKYHFGYDPDTDEEIAGFQLPNFTDIPHYTTWYLTKIESHDGLEVIDFNYIEDSYQYNFPKTKQSGPLTFNNSNAGPNIDFSDPSLLYIEIPMIYWTVDLSTLELTYEQGTNYVVDMPALIAQTGIGGTLPFSDQPDYNRLNYYGYFLESISSNNEVVLFYSDSEREDLELNLPFTTAYPASRGKKLDRISIQKGSEAGCKLFKLNYDYFEDFTSNKKDDVSMDLRLKLEYIQEFYFEDCNQTVNTPSLVIPPYEFTYHNSQTLGPDNRIYLPNRHSKAVDHWGYYNGEYDNNNYGINIPLTTVEYDPSSNGGSPQGITIGKSIRDTDEVSMKQGMLEKIKYPTGGLTEFDYEANSYYGQPLSFSPPPDHFGYIGECLTGGTSDAVFAIGNGFLSQADYQIDFIGNPCNPSGTPTVTIQLRESANPSIVIDQETFVNPGNSLSGKLTDLFPNIQVEKEYKISFPAPSFETKFTVKNLVPPTIPDANIQVGGLRIKSISSNDGIPNSQPIVREFAYEEDITYPPDKSSGFLYSTPRYGMNNFFYAATLPPLDQNNCFIDLSSYPIGSSYLFQDVSLYPLTSMEGYHIGYERVIEKVNNGGGWTEYVYEKEPVDHIYHDVKYPEPLPSTVINEFPFGQEPVRINAGKLKWKRDIDENGTIIHEAKYTTVNDVYDYFGVNTDPTLSSPKYRFIKTGISNQGGTVISTYTLRSKPYRLEKIETTQDGLTTIEEIGYDLAGKHYFPTSTLTTNSDGRIYETRTKYAVDYDPLADFGTNSNITIQDMLDVNLLNIPIEVQNWQGSSLGNMELVGGTLTTFKNVDQQGGSNPVIKPFQQYLLETTSSISSSNWPENLSGGLYSDVILDSRYKARNTIDYDDLGQGLISEVNTVPTSNPTAFIWNKTNRLPLAKTVNGKANDIAYSSFDIAAPLDPSNSNHHLEGNWTFLQHGGWDNTDAKTGLGQFDLNQSRKLQATVNTNGVYTLTLWSKLNDPIDFSENVGLNPQLLNSETTIDGWIYYEYQFSLTTGQTLIIKGSHAGYNWIDELRLYPADAQMTTYCYDEALRVHTITDINNRSTYYTYDGLGRLIEVRDHNGHLINQTEYKYHNE